MDPGCPMYPSVLPWDRSVRAALIQSHPPGNDGPSAIPVTPASRSTSSATSSRTAPALSVLVDRSEIGNT